MTDTPVQPSVLFCTRQRNAPRINRGSAGSLAGGGIAPLAGVRPRINQRAAALPRIVPCVCFLPNLGRALALVAALGSFPVEAAPPSGADPNSATARWVKTLRNQWGASCCDEADCRPTMARQTAAGWEVWIDAERYPGGTNAWEPVSPEVLAGTKADGPAPDSRTWACFWGGRVNCFLVGSGF